MTDRQRQFLDTYRQAKNLATALREMHISNETTTQWRKNDADFLKAYDAIARQRKGKDITQEEWNARIDNFFNLVKKMPVLDALKLAKIQTHKFVQLRRNDADFRRRYAQVKRSQGFNVIRDKSDQTAKRICIDCGRELPLSSFSYYVGIQKRWTKRCHSCLEIYRRRDDEEDDEIFDTKEIKKLRAKVDEFTSLMIERGKKGDFQGYQEARRQADYYRQKIEFIRQPKKKCDVVEYFTPIK